MRVFFYIPTLNAGGAEKQCALLASALKRDFGHDVSIILDRGECVKTTNRAILDSAGVATVGLPRGRIKSLFSLYKLFSHNRDAVLFTLLTRPNFVGGFVARVAGLKNVYGGIRCGAFPWWKFCLELVANRVLDKETIFNSRRAYNFFCGRGFKRAKCRVISNAFLPYPVGRRSSDGFITISTVGRFTPEKDYDTWLRVAKVVKNSCDRVRFLIEGCGKGEPEVRHLISVLGLQKDVTLLPGDFDVNEVLAQTDIYLSTSTSEGVSNAILEAMNAGLPVVATDVGDNNIMIEEERSGFILGVRAVEGLSAAVVRLAHDASRRMAFGQRAREILAERYSIRQVVRLYHNAIEG